MERISSALSSLINCIDVQGWDPAARQRIGDAQGFLYKWWKATSGHGISYHIIRAKDSS
jgi:hypothetical protein